MKSNILIENIKFRKIHNKDNKRIIIIIKQVFIRKKFYLIKLFLI